MSEQPKRKAVQAPVSAHPAFPAIVALWFAALFGIGSLVLPIALFESLSEASGLSTFVAAAQPPLGVTARIVIALIAGAIGVFAGLAIARKVTAAGAPRPAPQRAAAMRGAAQPGATVAKRPISAHEELGEGGLDAGAADEPRREALPGRRRALSMTDESARSEFLDHAPLPGQDFGAPAAFDPAPEPSAEPLEQSGEEPLDLAEFDAEPAAPEQLPVGPFGTAMLSGPPVPGASFTRAAQPHHPAPAETQPPAAAEDFAMTFARSPEPDAAAARSTVFDTPRDEPGIVDLVERFARALKQHREEAQLAAADELVVDVTFAFPGKAPPASAADPAACPAPFAPPANPPVPVPAALRPVGFAAFDDDDEDELPALGLSLLTPRPAARDAIAGEAAADAAGEDFEDLDQSEESYSSLLAMKGPFGLPREPVRIEDESDDPDGDAIEPVVVFPGQPARRASPAADGPARDAVTHAGAPLRPFDPPAARAEAAGRAASFGAPTKPADSGETERALREALEKLQKMSGVA